MTVATILTLTKKRTVFSESIFIAITNKNGYVDAGAPARPHFAGALQARRIRRKTRRGCCSVCRSGFTHHFSSSTLQVIALPSDIARCHVQSDLAHVRTLGGFVPMEFQFYYGSGYMAFTDGCGEAFSRRLLLATDTAVYGRGAVHVIDVVRGTHEGYLAAPGTIACSRGVATRKSRAAGGG